MKCLLCNFVVQNEANIKAHYISYHRIDQANFFFKKLIDGGQNSFYGKNCLHCRDFLTTKVIKNFHNFLKHYEMGFEESIDERPIKVTVRGDITIYNLNYHQHHKYYDFFNAERIVEDLIKQVSYIHKPTEKFQFKADFSIEIKQNAVNDSSYMSDIKTLVDRCIPRCLF